jgi:hypothetical protein
LSPAEARRQRSSDDWTRTYYLPEKQADLARRRADLLTRGLAVDLEVFRNLARERGTPVQGQEGITPETREALRAAFAEEIALRMAEHGFTAHQVSGLHGRGVDVVPAFEIGGRQERPLRDAAIRAEQAVLAEVVDVNMGEDLKDGRRSTVRLRVIDTLKGDAPVGRVYELRLRPGRDPDGEMVLPPGGSLHPDQLKRGERVVLFPSTAWYRLEAARVGAPARADRPWLTFNETELIRVRNGTLEGTHGTPAVSLDQLRAELRPVAQAWREVQALTATRLQNTPVISADGSAVRPAEAFYGSWIVRTVQGKSPPSAQSPILLQIDSGRMFARADCAHLGQLSYLAEGRSLRIGAPPRRLVVSCARGLSNHERAFSEVFQPQAAVRVVDGALLIEGAAGEVRATRTLSSPEVTLPLLPPSPLGDAAVLFGVLEVQGPCLYVRTAGTGERVTPALMQPAARDPAHGCVLLRSGGPGSRVGGAARRVHEDGGCASRMGPSAGPVMRSVEDLGHCLHGRVADANMIPRLAVR